MMENDYVDRMKSTRTHFDLVQKQLSSLTDQRDQGNRKLFDMRANEASVGAA